MNSSDKIIDRIGLDCDETVAKIEAEAREKRDSIISEAEKTASKNRAELEKQTLRKLAQMDASAKSRCELEIRNTVLKKRREEIDRTVEELKAFLLGQSDNDYFEFIYKLASKLNGAEGEVMLNAKDKSRLPADFSERFNASGNRVTVSENTADIDGGFILKNGNIEENFGISALISSNRDRLEDYINRGLFEQ